jgi:hypothetical protein
MKLRPTRSSDRSCHPEPACRQAGLAKGDKTDSLTKNANYKTKLTMRLILLSFVLAIVVNYNASAQGCVAIRSTGGFCTAEQSEKAGINQSGWFFNSNVRYFKSFRHFSGSEEQKHRVEEGTEVINHNVSIDLTLTRILNNRWSIAFNLPVISNARSSMYEHYGNTSKSPNARQSTHSFGVGDVRFSAYYWLIDPAKQPKGNIQAGLGIKLPTGDYRYQDYFKKNDTTSVLGPVDQSIQLGDGGTGFTTEINAYYHISRTVSLYGNFYYLINPREQNGVSSARGATPSASAIKNGSAVMSVPDQFMVRAGANFIVNNFMFSAGVREECLPARDLVGGSNGFRRPGYIISVEPGVTYNIKKVSVYAFVPVALDRNRTQSVPDKITSDLSGKKTIGDAAFADYAINIGCSFRF